MEDSFRRSLLRQPEGSFELEEPSFKDHTDNVCRLCCSNDSELRELFPGGYKEELLLRKIFNCTTVQISHGEDADALICSACEGKIEDFFQYREQCRSNDVLHRKWKRQYLGRSAPPRSSTLIPVVSVKSEPDDSEYFGPHELVPLDAHSDVIPDASANDESYDNPFDQPEHSTMNAEPAEQEDHNLLELMSPEHSFEASCIQKISKYDSKSDVDDNDFRMHIKQEPEDIDDSYGWTDMDDPDRSYGDASMNSGLIPVIEDTSVINTKESELAPKRGSPKCEDSKKCFRTDAAATEQETPASSMDAGEHGHEEIRRHSNQKSDSVVKDLRFDYKIVKNSKHRIRLLADGHMFVRETTRLDGTVTWRCRKNYDRCRATAEQHRDGTVTVFGRHDHVTINHTERRRNSNGTFAYKFVPSARGHKTLVVGGYRYMKFYVRADGSTLWRCANAPQCKAKASLEDDGKVYIRQGDVHNHEKSELPIASEDVERNKLMFKNMSTGMVNDGAIKGQEAAEEARTSYKSRSSVAVNVPVKCASKGAIVKKRRDADYRIITNKKGFQALVYKGYRYCKVRVRADGSIKWMCKMNRKTCHAGLFQYPDGRLEWMNAVRHNHEATDVDQVAASPVPEPAAVTKYHIDEETFTSSEWYLVRNKKNGTTLMHAGYRYNKNSVRSDMSSLWRCSRGGVGCRANIVMYPNETISKMDQVDHNHSPPPETDEPIIDDSLPNSEVGNGADDTVGSGVLLEEEDDPDANMRTLLNFTLGISADDSAAGSKEVLSRAEAGYRFIQNRRLTKSLLFRGYRYCKNNPRQDGSVQWICLMNKKTCRASVKTLSDGRLVLMNINHNHDPLEEDEEEDDAASASGYISENNNTTVDRKAVNGKPVANDSVQRTAQDRTINSHGYYYALNRSNRECLIFQQCRYSKSTTRADGSVVWRCMMAGGTCPASAIVHRDGSCISYRDLGHKHAPLSELPDAVRYPDADRSPSSSKENVSSPKVIITNSSLLYKQHLWKKTKLHSDGAVAQFECAEATGCPAVVKVKLQQNGDKPRILHETPHNHDGAIEKVPPARRRNSFPGHDGTFQLYKTVRGQLTLVYQDYRYSFRNRQMDGTTWWKCRSNKRCTARFYISKAGTVLPTGAQHLSHNHEKNGHTMRWAEPIRVKDEDFSNFDDMVQQCFSEMQAKQSAQGGKTIKYGGHTYTMRTVKPNGREHWRCALFQTKACRAALFCRNNGKIVEHTNSLPHTHKPIGSRVLPSRPKASPAKNDTTTVALYRPDAQVGLDAAGSQDFKFLGRNAKMIAFRRHRYCWNNQNRDGTSYYRCLYHSTARCSVMIKLDRTGTRIFAHSDDAHTHDPDFPENNVEESEVATPEVKALSSPRKKTLLFKLNAGPALTDFHFERSSRGATLNHRGYHYWSHNKLSSGWMVYRCRMQKLRCLAAGYYNPRERHFHLRQDVTHNHAAPEPSAERTEPTGSQQSIGSEIEPQPSVDHAAPNGKESPEETGITTEEYTFLRKKDGKIALSYAGSLYVFAGKREMADGGSCSIYNCYLDKCDASVELLPSGLVHAVEQNHRRHIPHDLQQMEEMGRGSEDFRIVRTSGGSAVMTFQGYRYYNNNINRLREDGSSRWYCQSTVAYEEKPDGGRLRKRCFIPLMMLPNGRVSSQGRHEHPVGRVLNEPTTHVTVGGQRFLFKRTLPNQSSLWRCAEYPSCGAVVYRLKNGKVQNPKPAHSHGDKIKVSSTSTPRLRILNGTTLAAKVSPPAAAAAAAPIKLVVSRKVGSVAPVTNVQSISMAQFEKTHGRRSFWYFGNRYYFYHTRSDGKQYWRCSARTNDCKCRAGLLRLSNGTIIPHNNEPHSHPDQMPGQTDPSIPNPPSLTETRSYGNTSVRKIKRKARELEEKVQRKVQLTEQQHMDPPATKVKPAAMEGGTFDYKILDQNNSSDILLEHKGVVYSLANKHTGGGRVYCCKNTFCQFEMLLLASGKLIPLSQGRHICEETSAATATTRTGSERVVEQLPSITPRAGDNSFIFSCKTTMEEREVEDPEDFLASDNRMDDDDHILPEAKRLRLTLHPEPVQEKVAARSENAPDDDEATDDEQKSVHEEEDQSTSGWLAVEQEEIIDSSYDNDEDGRTGSNRASSASHTPQDHGEEKEGKGTRPTTPAAVTSNAEDAASRKPNVDTHPHSHMAEEDESNDGSESHSKGGTKELVVSAEPHESYARKTSDKSIEDVSPSNISNDNNK